MGRDQPHSMSYELRERVPTPAELVRLRDRAGMSPRTIEAAERGLENTIFGVTVVHEGTVVAMGRIIGDDGCFYQIVDIAVDPDHQRRGLGSTVVDALVEYLHEHAPSSAYVSLIADVDGFYERWGFEDTAPDSKGMALRIE